jgi:hypothetical protein
VPSCSDFFALKGFPDEEATMLGRLFGKNKDASDEPVCYQCGRTLLAGEWTQKVVDDDGEEHLLCSLCGKARPAADGDPYEVGNGGANAARVAADAAVPADGTPGEAPGAPTRGGAERGENDALWKAIKDRDAQIERLNEQLAHSEAERQELIGLLARLQGEVAEGGATDVVAAVAPAPEIAVPPADQLPLDEDTAAIPAVEAPDYEEAAAEPEAAAADEAVAEDREGVSADEDVVSGAAEIEAQAASMTLLQRGVDLLNVSPVPRKIAETNADLGIPTVHVGFDGETATVTFMWSMGWYRFAVDIESGKVRLGDRGYEDRGDLQPNASVRADGTVHLAAARISRAAAQRQQGDAPSAAAESDAPAEPEVSEAPADEPGPATGGPEILSKSLLGQRTDDERPSWEQTQARDFDWDH